jgi:flavin-dependent dehydrogenase
LGSSLFTLRNLKIVKGDITMKATIPRKILIVGGGTAGWMAANLLMAAWGKHGISINLVESPDVPIIGVGEGSTPLLKRFFSTLNIAEQEWMPACNATYKLGIRFAGWSTRAGYEHYFHPFFSALDEQATQQFFKDADQQRKSHNAYVHPDNYFLATRLANQKLSSSSLPADQQAIEYGYHFDSGLLGAFLRKHAIGLGLTHISDHVVQVKQTSDGAIDCICTQANGELQADLYIDCTGFSGLLISKTLKEKTISFKENLFNDSAMAVQTPMVVDMPTPVETRSETLSAGWAWSIPLANRVGNGYVYSSDFISRDAAEKEFREHLGLLDKNIAIKHLTMPVGRIQLHWKKNCLAVGLSQGFIEPLEATALMTTQGTIENFINCINHVSQVTDAVKERFNFHVNNMIEGIRDYIVTHYCVNSRTDTDYWRACRSEVTLSDELSCVLNAWNSGGNIMAELAKQRVRQNYYPVSWYCLLMGYGVYNNN